MELSFFYLLKKQPTLILRDIITSIQVYNRFHSDSLNFTVYLIPSSPSDLFFKKRLIKSLDSYFDITYDSGYILNHFINGKEICIKIKLYDYSFLYLFLFLLKSLFASIVLFFYYFILNRSIKDILHSKFNNIQYGDIAASTIFRNKKIFKLYKSFELIKESFRLINLIQLLTLVGAQQKSSFNKNYFSILDFTYSEALLLRSLPLYNFKFIETQDYKSEIVIINNPPLYYYPWMARSSNNIFDSDIINKYYHSRLFSPTEVLDYMWLGANDNQNTSVLLESGKTFLPNLNEKYAVLFLHAFSDAAFCYANDGFKDLLEWVLYTVNKLLENKEINKILIKPHPNISFSYYPADQDAILFIKRYFSGNNKVFFLQKDSSLVALCKFENIIGITRHGSVAEEMTYLKKPVIAYQNGPWKNYHKFLITWNDKKNYENLLLNLDFEIMREAVEKNRYLLFEYCMEYRINSRNISRGWYDELYKIEHNEEFVGNFENILKLDSIILKKKINSIISYLLTNSAIK